jgi:hypothetical protein
VGNSEIATKRRLDGRAFGPRSIVRPHGPSEAYALLDVAAYRELLAGA